MPKKETTPSFIVELSLKTSSSDSRGLLTALECGRQLYNACLGESLKRLKLMRDAKSYKKALSLPKGKNRSELFKSLREQYGFKDSAVQSFAVKTKNSCHLGDHLDVHTTQKVSTRAFNAVNEYSLGKKGRPRFKGKGQFDSLESKTNKNGIRYRDGWVFWRGLELECLINPKDKVIAHGLSCPVKYCRIVRRKLKGRDRFSVQLVVEGLSYQKHTPGEEEVGIDIGPSTIAYVSETRAELKQFCEELNPIEKELRVLQRKLDRQRRANNPNNFNTNGTVKQGVRLLWHDSARYKDTKVALAELQRLQSNYRKTLQGRLANEILKVGMFIKLEDLSYKAFQKQFGRSIGRRAPALFVSSLTRKAERAGGYLQKVPTRTTKLSQSCICGKLKKKSLSQRWHSCDCGAVAQRDLFSAFLAKCVNDQNILDISRAQELWTGTEPLLRQAVSRLIESANGKALPSSFGLTRRQSGSSVYPCAAVGTAECETVDVRDVVAESLRESPGRDRLLHRNPDFSHGEVQGLRSDKQYFSSTGYSCILWLAVLVVGTRGLLAIFPEAWLPILVTGFL